MATPVVLNFADDGAGLVQGTEVWVPTEAGTYAVARLIGPKPPQKGDKGPEYIVEVNNEKHQFKQSEVFPRNPAIQEGLADMATLSYLNEPGVLHNILRRFEQGNIYTFTGPILVAVNPYRMIPKLYGPEAIASYRHQTLGKLPPHVYAIAEEAYQRMRREDYNQSVLVSGESGAGKTETTKILLEFLASVSVESHKKLSAETGAASTAPAMEGIEQRVLKSTPILEAFGNAKTLFNDNSSRFGKYIQVEFGRTGSIVSSSIRTYLLERSRIVRVQPGERNYHIFYDLFYLEKELIASLKLTGGPASFFYLAQSKVFVASENSNDEVHLQKTIQAMQVVGLSKEEQHKVWRILAAVLHLGNVQLETNKEGKAAVKALDELKIVADLLEVSAPELQSSIILKKMRAGTTEMLVPLDQDKAERLRDSLAMNLYGRVFDWLVTRINLALCPAGSATTQKKTFIGILDIYGFEVFERNSFEQFCINYANEKLQALFNDQILAHLQQEYIAEGIAWTPVEYRDNKECLQIIERRPDGILALLDEESTFPKATDKSFVEKLYMHCSKHRFFEKPRFGALEFLIKHYAGKVSYNVTNFLEKNTDFLVAEQQSLMENSKFDFVALLFKKPPAPPVEPGAAPPLSPRSRGSTLMERPEKMTAASRTRSETKMIIAVPKAGSLNNTAQFISIAQQFRDSLAQLMSTLESTTCHYIRCIKPNTKKAAMESDPKNVLHQVRCSGLVETTKISSLGFPNRISYDQFALRYALVIRGLGTPKPGQSADVYAAISKKVIVGLKVPAEDFRMGKTKLFLRSGFVADMEATRDKALQRAACIIQSKWLSYQARKRFLRIRKAVVKLQRWWRAKKQRRLYLQRKRRAIKMQALIRGHLALRRYQRARRVLIKVQARWRGKHMRSKFMLQRRVLIKLQARWRGKRQRVKYLRQRVALVRLQARFRGVRQRKRFARQKHVLMRLQARWRGKLQRTKFLHQKAALIVLQARIRGRRQRVKYQKTRSAMIVVQSLVRKRAANNFFLQTRAAVVKSQSHVRRWLAVRHLVALKAEVERKRVEEEERLKREEARLRAEEEEKERVRQEEERLRLEEEERLLKEEEERQLAEENRLRDLEEKKRKEEAERKRKDEAEKRRREQEERERQEEEEKLQREEEEKIKLEAQQRKQEAEAKLKRETEAAERALREETERKRLEQEEAEENERLRQLLEEEEKVKERARLRKLKEESERAAMRLKRMQEEEEEEERQRQAKAAEEASAPRTRAMPVRADALTPSQSTSPSDSASLMRPPTSLAEALALIAPFAEEILKKSGNGVASHTRNADVTFCLAVALHPSAPPALRSVVEMSPHLAPAVQALAVAAEAVEANKPQEFAPQPVDDQETTRELVPLAEDVPVDVAVIEVVSDGLGAVAELTEPVEHAADVVGASDTHPVEVASVDTISEPVALDTIPAAVDSTIATDAAEALEALDVLPVIEEAEVVAEEEAYGLPDETGPELHSYELAYEGDDVPALVEEAELLNAELLHERTLFVSDVLASDVTEPAAIVVEEVAQDTAPVDAVVARDTTGLPVESAGDITVDPAISELPKVTERSAAPADVQVARTDVLVDATPAAPVVDPAVAEPAEPLEPIANPTEPVAEPVEPAAKHTEPVAEPAPDTTHTLDTVAPAELAEPTEPVEPAAQDTEPLVAARDVIEPVSDVSSQDVPVNVYQEAAAATEPSADICEVLDVVPIIEEAELVAEEEAYGLPDETGPELHSYELAYEGDDVNDPIAEAELLDAPLAIAAEPTAVSDTVATEPAVAQDGTLAQEPLSRDAPVVPNAALADVAQDVTADVVLDTASEASIEPITDTAERTTEVAQDATEPIARDVALDAPTEGVSEPIQAVSVPLASGTAVVEPLSPQEATADLEAADVAPTVDVAEMIPEDQAILLLDETGPELHPYELAYEADDVASPVVEAEADETTSARALTLPTEVADVVAPSTVPAVVEATEPKKDKKEKEGKNKEEKDKKDKEGKDKKEKESKKDKQGKEKKVKEVKEKKDKEKESKKEKQGKDKDGKKDKEKKPKVKESPKEKSDKQGKDKKDKEGKDKKDKDKEENTDTKKKEKDKQDKDGKHKEGKDKKDKESKVKEGKIKKDKEGKDKDGKDKQAKDKEGKVKKDKDTKTDKAKSLDVSESGAFITGDLAPTVQVAELVPEDQAIPLPDETGPELHPYELAYEADDVAAPVDEAEAVGDALAAGPTVSDATKHKVYQREWIPDEPEDSSAAAAAPAPAPADVAPSVEVATTAGDSPAVNAEAVAAAQLGETAANVYAATWGDDDAPDPLLGKNTDVADAAPAEASATTEPALEAPTETVDSTSVIFEPVASRKPNLDLPPPPPSRRNTDAVTATDAPVQSVVAEHMAEPTEPIARNAPNVAATEPSSVDPPVEDPPIVTEVPAQDAPMDVYHQEAPGEPVSSDVVCEALDVAPTVAEAELVAEEEAVPLLDETGPELHPYELAYEADDVVTPTGEADSGDDQVTPKSEGAAAATSLPVNPVEMRRTYLREWVPDEEDGGSTTAPQDIAQGSSDAPQPTVELVAAPAEGTDAVVAKDDVKLAMVNMYAKTWGDDDEDLTAAVDQPAPPPPSSEPSPDKAVSSVDVVTPAVAVVADADAVAPAETSVSEEEEQPEAPLRQRADSLPGGRRVAIAPASPATERVPVSFTPPSPSVTANTAYMPDSPADWRTRSNSTPTRVSPARPTVPTPSPAPRGVLKKDRMRKSDKGRITWNPETVSPPPERVSTKKGFAGKPRAVSIKSVAGSRSSIDDAMEVLDVKQATLPPAGLQSERERLQAELRKIEEERKRLEKEEASIVTSDGRQQLSEEEEEKRFLEEEDERARAAALAEELETKRLADLADRQKKVASMPVTALVPPLPPDALNTGFTIPAAASGNRPEDGKGFFKMFGF